MNQNAKGNTRRVRSRRRGVRHLLALIVVTGVVAATGLAAAIWWQERPLRQAAEYLDQGDPNKALSTIEGFLRSHPQHGGAMSLRARTLVAVGRPIEAIEAFEQSGGSNPKEIHAWAQALLQLQRWPEAILLLEHLRKIGVDRADVLHELAACRSEVGDQSGAIVAATEFAHEPGCAARGNFLLGSLHNKSGNLRLAATAWGDVLRDSPDAEGLQVAAAVFFLDYARVLQVSGQSRMAAELVERSLSLDQNPDGQVVLGDARADLGDRAAAEESYKAALEVDPGRSAARTGLAKLALANGDAAAAKVWLAPLETPEKLTREIAVLLQQATSRLGDAEASAQWREKADKLQLAENARNNAMKLLKGNPGSNLAQVVRAYQLAESGDWLAAAAILEPIAGSAAAPPFVQDLYQAVQQNSDLPSLDLLPMEPF